MAEGEGEQYKNGNAAQVASPGGGGTAAGAGSGSPTPSDSGGKGRTLLWTVMVIIGGVVAFLVGDRGFLNYGVDNSRLKQQQTEFAIMLIRERPELQTELVAWAIDRLNLEGAEFKTRKALELLAKPGVFERQRINLKAEIGDWTVRWDVEPAKYPVPVYQVLTRRVDDVYLQVEEAIDGDGKKLGPDDYLDVYTNSNGESAVDRLSCDGNITWLPAKYLQEIFLKNSTKKKIHRLAIRVFARAPISDHLQGGPMYELIALPQQWVRIRKVLFGGYPPDSDKSVICRAHQKSNVKIVIRKLDLPAESGGDLKPLLVKTRTRGGDGQSDSPRDGETLPLKKGESITVEVPKGGRVYLFNPNDVRFGLTVGVDERRVQEAAAE